MPLKVTCPRCRKLHRNIDKRLLGKKFQCDCGKVMRLGGGSPKAKPDAAAKSRPLDTEPSLPAQRLVSPTRLDKPSDNEIIPFEGQTAPEEINAPVSGIDKTLESNPLSESNDSQSPKTSGGHDFDDIDDLIQVGEMRSRPDQPGDFASDTPQSRPAQPDATVGSNKPPSDDKLNRPTDRKPKKAPPEKQQSEEEQPKVEQNEKLPMAVPALPIAEAVDSSPDLDNLEVDIQLPSPPSPVDGNANEIHSIEDSVEDSVDEKDASFEVLDDSDEDIIDLSDADIVVGAALPAQPTGADFGQLPAAPTHPVYPTGPNVQNAAQQTAQPVIQPILAERAPTPAMPAAAMPAANQPTPTSMNPAYRAFGPPPVAHYPDEPAVPDGPSTELAVGASASGFQRKINHQGAASPESVVALIVSFLATILGLWVAFKSYQVVSWFLPGTAFPSGRLTGQAGILAFLYGFRMLAGLGLLVGGCLFFVNEIMRLNGTDPMPYSCIIALVAGCAFLLIEFGVICYAIFNLTAMSAYGINNGASLFVILVAKFLISLIPIALIVFAALRQK